MSVGPLWPEVVPSGGAATRSWLPDQDLNLDKQIQNLQCYHYTIGHYLQGLN